MRNYFDEKTEKVFWLQFNIDHQLFVIVSKKIDEKTLKLALSEYQNDRQVNGKEMSKKDLLSYLKEQNLVKDEFDMVFIRPIL